MASGDAAIDDPIDERRARRQLRAVSLGLCVLVAVAALVRIATGLSGPVLWFYLVFLLMFAVVAAASGRVGVRPLAWSLVTCVFVTMSGLAALTGGVASEAYAGMPVLVLTAGLFLGARGALVAAAAGVGAGVLLVGLDAAGALPASLAAYNSGQLLVVRAGALAAAGGLTYVAVRQLRTALAEARANAVQIQRANAELRRTTAVLAERTAELERANHELERFASSVSHDLKEPLRMVTSFCGLLQRKLGPRLEAREQRYLELAVDGAQRMNGMIDGMLELSRIARDVERRDVDVAALVEATLSDLELALDEAGARVTLHVPADLRVRAHGTQLGTALQNLVLNSVRYRSERPLELEVRAELRGRAWTLAVRDNGIGIRAEDRERVLEPYQRLHPRDEIPGLGLGLSLVARVARAHGGSVQVGPGLDGIGCGVELRMPRDDRIE